MKLLSGILTITLAIIISVVAEYFSIVGLAALFAATAVPVMIMGAVLGAGKLVGAQWLKSNWTNPRVNILHKAYLLLAILILMLITSLGIYGFLSKGHLEQEAPMAGLELQVAQKEQQITMLQEQNKRLTDKMTQLDAGVNSYLSGDNADKALRARNKQKAERAAIDQQLDANNAQIHKLNEEILPLKLKNSEVEAKLGPVKYVAELFGWKDPGTAVRFVIITLMFAFDPLAVVLLLSGTITLTEYFEERGRKATMRKAEQEEDKVLDVPVEPAVEPSNEPVVIPEPEPEVQVVVEEVVSQPEPQEVEFIKEVIASGNATPEVQQDVAPAVDAPKKQRKPRKPRKQKDQAIAINHDVPNVEAEEQGNLTLENFVKAAYQGAPLELEVPKEKEQLIEILEKRPELLENMIDVISEAANESQKKVQVNDEDIKQPEVTSTDESQEKPRYQGGSWLGERKTKRD